VDTYAGQRPSGENAGSVSTNGVATIQWYSGAPLSKSSPTSKLSRLAEKPTSLPSGDQVVGHRSASVSASSVSSPEA